MKTIRRIGLILAGLIIGLLIAEGLARLVLPKPTRQIALIRARAPDLQMDAGTDVKNPGYNPFLQRRPSSEWTCDGKTSETMNNEGFRDRLFQIEKAPGKKRVAIIGDSFAEGWMGPRKAAFPRALESLLGDEFEVLNFSLANRSPLRYVALYDRIVRKYRPDSVLVCLYQNDMAEDEILRPYVKFDAREAPDSFDYARYFRNTPRMPQTWMEKRLDRLQWKLCLYSRLFPYAAVYFTVDAEHRRRSLEMPSPDSLDALWKNTAGYLLALRELARRDQALFLLAYAPDQSEFAAPNPLRARARQLASENQIPFFGAEKFLAEARYAAFYLPEDGHFSAEGHRRYAVELAEWIRPLISHGSLTCEKCGLR